MKLLYHRLAVQDIREVLDYYESEAGRPLADRFFRSLLDTIAAIQSDPKHFPPLAGTALRRANLRGFPHHILFEEMPWGVKLMVIRHHRRSPRYGLRRQ